MVLIKKSAKYKSESELASAEVDKYFAVQSDEALERLTLIRDLVKKLVPDATEVISYGMPAFRFHGMLLYYSANKNHIGLYALPTSNIEFANRLKEYKTGKGSIQFPFTKPLPVDLIEDIIMYRVKENLIKKDLKKKK